MSPNTPRLLFVLAAALAFPAGAQTAGSLRADFQNGAYPASGYSGTTDVTITVQKENDGDENGNYHSNTEVAAGGFPARQSTLMRFALDGGQVPAGVTITAAELELYVTDESWTGFSVYEVLRPWDGKEATFLNATSNQAWDVPGAAGVGVDRSAVPFSTFGHLDGGYALAPLTDAGVDLVRRWFNGGAPNNGVIVQDYDSWDKMAWASSDDTTRPLPPNLVVHYGVSSFAQVPVTDDTTIAYQPKGNFDGWGLGCSGHDGGSTSSLIRWDVSAIPPGVKVTNAGILFTVDRLPAKADAGPVSIYPALVPWTEQANWQTYDGTNSWAVPGAQGLDTDHAAKVGAFPPTCTAANSICAVTPTGLIGVVQKWVDDPSTNHGLSLQNYVNDDDLQLIDSEAPVPGIRPKLTVQFSWDAGSPLKVYPAYAEVNPTERVSMKALGGTSPYRYSVSGISGGANIDDAGVYTAGLFAGQDQVHVVDEGGAEAFATILVVANSTADGGSPITISFPNPSPPVAPQRNFAVTALISSRAASPVSGLVLDIGVEALNLDTATLVGSGRLTGNSDAGFLLPVLETGASFQVSISGVMNAVPQDNPSVTAAVRSGPLVLAKATTPVPLGVPPAIGTGCSCGPTSGGMGAVLLAGILQTMARRRASRRGR
ncbi:MAG TPA: DNRLRE domain-containing protein [Myxococcaceae bacterium]|nr:DNRLRE domain-containing protein [Myxococcaceae bacterium]